jgi:hypothetical protein
MRNYVEMEKCMFAGVFVFSAANAGNTKRPGVMFDFFTRPTWFKNVDPEAGCDVKVGLESHNLMSGVVRALGHVATSESGVRRRTKLTNGLQLSTIGRPVYNFPSGSGLIQSPTTRQDKKVSLAKRFNQGGLGVSNRCRQRGMAGPVPLRERIAPWGPRTFTGFTRFGPAWLSSGRRPHAMHLVMFDIDGTLTETMKVDEECFVRSLAEVCSFTEVETDWSSYKHATDSGIFHEIHLARTGRYPSVTEVSRFRQHFVALLAQASASTSRTCIRRRRSGRGGKARRA